MAQQNQGGSQRNSQEQGSQQRPGQQQQGEPDRTGQQQGGQQPGNAGTRQERGEASRGNGEQLGLDDDEEVWRQRERGGGRGDTGSQRGS